MVGDLLFVGVGDGANEKKAGAGQKRIGSATLLLNVFCGNLVSVSLLLPVHGEVVDVGDDLGQGLLRTEY